MSFNATVAIAERYITSPDGTTVFAQAVGNSHLPTLVFVHGLAMSALVWSNILKDVNLLRLFHLVAYDMRGHGRSGKPDALEAYSSERYAEDFGAVLKAFKVTSPPILVGWSLGASIATDVTAFYGPDALAGVVFTGGLPWLSASGIVASEFSRGLDLGNTGDASRALQDRIAFTTNLFNYPERVPTEVLWSWIGGSCMQPPAKFVFVMARTQNETNISEAGAKGVPLLLIHGDADRFVDGKKAREVVGDRFKDLTVRTVLNGSHAFFYEEQAMYVRELSKFAKRVFANRSK